MDPGSTLSAVDRRVVEVDGEGRVVVRLHVQPGAGRSEIVGRHGDALKVRVAAAPEGGRANQACERLLAESFDVETSAVTLLTGETSRSKRFALEGVDGVEVAERLERLLSIDRRGTADPRLARRPIGR